MNSYTQQQFGAPPSPVSRGFGQATSPGPVVTQDMGYISSPGPASGVDHVGYPSTSPQPAGFGPGIAVSQKILVLCKFRSNKQIIEGGLFIVLCTNKNTITQKSEHENWCLFFMIQSHRQ